MYAKGVKLVSIAAFFLMFMRWFAAKSQLWSVGDGGYMELLAFATPTATGGWSALGAGAGARFWRSKGDPNKTKASKAL